MGEALVPKVAETVHYAEPPQQGLGDAGLSLAATIVEAKHQIAYLAGTEPDSIRIIIEM